MRESLKKYLFITYNSFCKKKDSKAIGEWIENPSHHGQLVITASQIIWTSDCENILRSLNSDKPDKGKAWKGLK
jgi:dynein heavy chain